MERIEKTIKKDSKEKYIKIVIYFSNQVKYTIKSSKI